MAVYYAAYPKTVASTGQKSRRLQSMAQKASGVSSEETSTPGVLQGLASKISEGIVVLDYQQHILFVNSPAETYFGVFPGQMIGRGLSEFTSKSQYNLVVKTARMIRKNQTGDLEATIGIQTTSGQERPLRFMFSFIGDYLGHKSCLIAVLYDPSTEHLTNTILRNRLALEQIVAAISTDFIKTSTQNFDKVVLKALASIGQFAGVDRCYVNFFSEETEEFQENYEWQAEGLPPLAANLNGTSIRNYPWSYRKLTSFEIIKITNLDDLPPEAEAEHQAFSQAGHVSLLGIPLSLSDILIGYLGMSTTNQPRTWSDSDLLLLRMVGEIILNLRVRKRMDEELHQVEVQLADRVQQLELQNREVGLITQLSTRLQSCEHLEDAYTIIAEFANNLFPQKAGVLLTTGTDDNQMIPHASWGMESMPEITFDPQGCWALQMGRPYHTLDTSIGPLCPNLKKNPPASYMCIPIRGHQGDLGVLHLRTQPNQKPWADPQAQIAAAVAESMGLALSNLQLREKLREQAIRDPLTSLYNRYYMEAALEQALSRSERSSRPVCIIMLDLDHFKDFNDRYGHPTGDKLLQELGRAMRNSFRASDITCRYGGEEFLIIMPDTTMEIAIQRAEELRLRIKRMVIQDEIFGPCRITASFGVARSRPWHPTPKELIREADQALFQAKERRDTVVVFE